MKNQARLVPFHPFFIAAYPVLSMLAANLGEVQPWATLRPLGVALLGAGALLMLLRLPARSWRRAALATSLLLGLFFSFGHLYDVTRWVRIGEMRPFRLTTLAALYTLVGLVGLWVILRRKARGSAIRLTAGLNLVTVVLAAMPLVQVGVHLARSALLPAGAAASSVLVQPGQVAQRSGAPDIYYIVLDSYSRSDVLKSKFNYDNSAFTRGLEELGFHVLRCARSNYEYTKYSIASSLNMDYIQQLGSDFHDADSVSLLMEKLIKHSEVRRLVEAAGYRTVAFANGFQWTEWTDADMFLQPKANSGLTQTLSPFEGMLLRSTAVRLLTDAPQTRALLQETVQGINFPYEQTVLIERYAFDQLDQAAALAGPKFVYAHLMTTHDPIIFDAQGALITDPAFYPPPGQNMPPGYFTRGAVGEFEYTNTRMLKILRTLIEQSTVPPVILVQGDHGRANPRTAILSAYYLPGEDTNNFLEEDMTPVNSFRMVFNHYLMGQFDLLENKSYHLDGTTGVFTIVPETMAGCR